MPAGALDALVLTQVEDEDSITIAPTGDTLFRATMPGRNGIPVVIEESANGDRQNACLFQRRPRAHRPYAAAYSVCAGGGLTVLIPMRY